MEFLPVGNAPERGGVATPLFVIAVALSVSLCSGCGNSCFVFISNPSDGVIFVGAGSGDSVCLVPKPQPQGTIKVTAQLASMCGGCAGANRVNRVFLTLRGIALRSEAGGAQGSAVWTDLKPELEHQPLQIELGLSPPDAVSRFSLAGSSFVAAGSYDQVRLRLALGQPEAGIPSGADPCTAVGSNCIEMADGQVYPLAINSREPELIIGLAEMPSGHLLVEPDTESELNIELIPLWSAVQSGGEGLQFRIALVGHIKLGQPTAPKNEALETTE